jgi:hypothetical protein
MGVRSRFFFPKYRVCSRAWWDFCSHVKALSPSYKIATDCNE